MADWFLVHGFRLLGIENPNPSKIWGSLRALVDKSRCRGHTLPNLVLLWSRLRESSAGFATPIWGNIVTTASRRVRVFRPALDTLDPFSLVSVLPALAGLNEWMGAIGGGNSR
jgi:hypothetical protein